MTAMMKHSSIVLLCLALASGCRRGETAAAPVASPSLAVSAHRTSRTTHPQFIAVPATIRPAQRATLAAQVSGTIREFPATLGQQVSAGDILIHVSAPELEARLDQARAQLAEAERVAARERGLSGTGANSQDSVKDAESRLRVAQAAVAEAAAQLSHSTLRAPFAGAVVETYVLRGDLATPGKPLILLEATEGLRAEGSIPESLALGLRAGDPLGMRLAGVLVQARIAELSSAADPVTRGRSIKVDAPAGTVRSGQLVELLAPGPAAAGIFVPVGAVRTVGQMEQVFVIHDGRARLRLVRTGREQEGAVEIVSGLSEGESIVSPAPASLRDGQQVTVLP